MKGNNHALFKLVDIVIIFCSNPKRMAHYLTVDAAVRLITLLMLHFSGEAESKLHQEMRRTRGIASHSMPFAVLTSNSGIER